MPEVAEVALTAQILEKYLKGTILEELVIVSGRYTKKDPTNYQKFVKNLPLKINEVNSQGKFMWMELSPVEKAKKPWYIWFTFGLTGAWSFNPTKYTRYKLITNDKTAYYDDMRNFGTIKFSRDSDTLEKKIEGLRPDFLKDDFNLKSYQNIPKPIIDILMSQDHGSGIGNHLSAEILYRARLSPHRLGTSLSSKELARLANSIKYVTKLAYMNDLTLHTKNQSIPMKYLHKELANLKRHNYHPRIHLNEPTYNFKVYRRKTDPKGNPVVAENIYGTRTTYWVPKLQH